MKKRMLILLAAALTVFSVSGCTVNVTEETVETEKETEKKTEKEKETEEVTEKVTEEKTEKESETEITLSKAYIEGTVTDWSDDAITVDADDGNSYEIDISDATWELDDYGLYDGIYVGCNLKSATSKDGVFTATDLDELDDPAEDQKQTSAQTTAQSSTTAQSNADTAYSTDLTGTISGADGSSFTLDCDDDGNIYYIDYSGAEVQCDDNGLVDGSYVEITLESTEMDNDGYFVATFVEQLDDPDEDSSSSSASSGVASSTDLTGYVYGADGSTLTLDCDDGNTYSIYYADASVEDTDDGLVDGSYCEITIATVDVSADGNWTALDVEQLDDPDEDPS